METNSPTALPLDPSTSDLDLVERAATPDPDATPVHTATGSSAATADTKGASKAKGFAGMSRAQMLLAALAIAMLCWGAWVSKAIVGGAADEPQLVKLQLQGMISEYLNGQARSGANEQIAAQSTAAFLAELDLAVAELSEEGRVVLVNEAVIGGDIPDVTEAVKARVYSKVARPAVAAAPVQQDMQAYMAANGGTNGR
ncbi:MAG: TrbI F-type domain-containing protein [Alteraurantiacibacter sp.]